MKERPILFSAPMVLALLDGSKTQTRRVAPIADLNIKPNSDDLVTWGVSFSKPVNGVIGSHSGGKFTDGQARRIIASQFNPYGQPGDRLWVRETWCHQWNDETGHQENGYWYRATTPDVQHVDSAEKSPWKPSIHMPRAASRITLEITGVRVERLQDISAADAFAEGVYDGTACRCAQPLDFVRSCGNCGGRLVDAVDLYRSLWESINGPHSWEANPWVWVIEFKRATP